MSNLGKRLITAAKQANAIVRGEADPATYTMHVPVKKGRKVRAKTTRKAARRG